MYAEYLQTPHNKRLGPIEAQEPLLATLQPDEITLRLASIENHDELFSQLFVEADEVSDRVHKTLLFRANDNSRYNLTPEAVADDQLTNCHGHTIVLSECLEHVNIPHYISYANGHSFVMITDFGEHAYLLDAVSPYFNGSMVGSIRHSDLAEVPQQIATHGFGAVRFRTDEFVDSNTKLYHELDSLSTKHQWLTKDKRIALGSGHGMAGRHFLNRGRFIRNHTLVTSIHEPEAGRQLLEDYERFSYSATRGKNVDAYKHLRAITGRYPEVDSMVSREEVETFAYTLAAKGYVALAVNVAQGVGNTYQAEISRDIKLQAWRGDILREIGRIAKDASIVGKAIDIYENAPNSASNMHIQGKILKARRIQATV